MQPAASCCLLFFTFLCCVQCQWVQFVGDDNDLKNLTNGLPESKPGWGPYDHHQSHHGRRTRRQAYYNKYPTYGGGGYSWKHYFTIPPIYSASKESAYIREENIKRLKNTLEKDTIIQFLNPTGLRISIPADSINVRILDFRFKLNEEFRENDGGHYAATSSKRGGLWTYDVPDLQLQQGNKVYYWLKVNFIKEGTDVIVNGILDIERGNPHSGGDMIAFRPTTAPVITQASYGAFTPTLGGGLGGGMMGAFSWNHQFAINASYGSSFSQSSSSNWLWQAEQLKNSLQNVQFQFSNPTGLMILIPDGNINRIDDFRVKINEEFRANDGGLYAPTSHRRGGLWTYDVPLLQARQGDRIYYLMTVKLGTEGVDAIVRGVLTITYGNPHQGSNLIQTTQPTYSQPSPQIVNSSPSVGGGLGGGTSGQQEVRWEHRFNINTTYSTAFTEDSANRWFEEAQVFRDSLENNIKFDFFYPSGLRISIAGDSEKVKILAFNIKLNDEFRTLSPGNYVANISRSRNGQTSYYYPNLRLNQGDRVYYWMRVTLGKQAFDNIVKGMLEITKGDPHIGRPYQPQPLPTHLAPVGPGTPPTRWPSISDPYQNPNQNLKPYPPNPNQNQKPKPNPPNQYQKPYRPNVNPNQNQKPYSPNQNQNQNQKPYRPNLNPNQNYKPSTPNQNSQLYPTTSSTQSPEPYPPYVNPSDRDPSQTSESCDPSLTTVNNGGDATPTCSRQILMDHKFYNLDGWTHQISIGGKNLEDEFLCFTNNKENCWTQQGRLYIKPTLLEDRSNDSFVRRGELSLPWCTLSNQGPSYCKRRAQGFNILPPVDSARINSENMFTFRYGIIEIRAKFPRGDWLVPELWLQSTNPAVEEKVVLGVSTGNSGSTANTLGVGVIRNSGKTLDLMNYKGSSAWYQTFHTYKLEWAPDQVKYFVDNRQIHELPTNSFPIFSQEVFISLGIHAASYRDFPDDLFPNKPWEYDDPKRFLRFWNASELWYPSWKIDPTLQVDSIKVTAL